MTAGPDVARRRREVVIAGHTGDDQVVRDGLVDEDPSVRDAALGAARRRDTLTLDDLHRAIADPAAVVRRRAAEIVATRADVEDHDVLRLLGDDVDDVVETAAWACGERVEITEVSDALLQRLVDLATGAEAALVRESAVAALGAIGDPRGLPAILQGCRDRPAVRRRAVLALAPFEGPEVDEALARAREDRDWQVRQSAEDVSPPTG